MTTKRLSFVFLFALAGTLAACQQATTPQPGQPLKPSYTSEHWKPLAPQQSQDARLSPHFGRHARRLSVAQLRVIVPRLFGGITWTDSEDRVMFDRLSRTLGEADYVFQTENNRELTPLFMKFMDDMAGNVCKKAVRADLQNSDETKRHVVRYERDIDQTLRFLRLKFHTLYIPPKSLDGINPLRRLYDDILLKTSDRAQAWTGVCVAVLTAPEFFAY
jgi:hypothetical protein